MNNVMGSANRTKWILALSVLPWFVLLMPLDGIFFDLRMSGFREHIWGFPGPILNLTQFNPAQIGQLFILIGDLALIFAWLVVFQSLLESSNSRKKICLIAMIIFPFVSLMLYWILLVSGTFRTFRIVASAPIGHRFVTNTFAVYFRDILHTGIWILSVLVALYALSLAPATRSDTTRGRFIALTMALVYLLLAISSFVAFLDVQNSHSVNSPVSLTAFSPRGWWVALPITMILSTLLALWAFVATRSPRNKEVQSLRG